MSALGEHSRRVPGAHGLSLNLWEWPSPGEPLMFLHGFLLHARAWDFVIAPFTGKRRVFALDCRGHGQSDRDPKFRYHHAAFGMDLRRVLEHLDVGPVDLVAHSTFGHAAIGLAARVPALLRRLILIEAGPELSTGGRGGARASGDLQDPSFANAAEYAKILARTHGRARPEVIAQLAATGLEVLPDGRFAPTFDPDFTRPKTSENTSSVRKSFDRRAWASEGERQLWSELAEVPCPTLVVRGSESKSLSQSTVDRMLEVLPNGRTAEIPEAGHNVMLDQPERLAETIAEFFEIV